MQKIRFPMQRMRLCSAEEAENGREHDREMDLVVDLLRELCRSRYLLFVFVIDCMI